MLVAEYGGFRQATEHMGLTQSAVSEAVACVEAEVDIHLMERGHRGVTLTQGGHGSVERARAVVLATSDLENEVEARRNERAGGIRLAAWPYLISAFLMPVPSRFLASRPLARFAIKSTLMSGAMLALQIGDADQDFEILFCCRNEGFSM